MLEEEQLVVAAQEALASVATDDRHTVAAAARNADGEVFTGVNVFHFTGGPCAELVVLGVAAGRAPFVSMVAVKQSGVVPPCGRCRQVLFDYFPDLQVVVGLGDQCRRRVSIRELLPWPPYLPRPASG